MFFFSRIFQNCLLFIPAKQYIKYWSGITWINSPKSNGMTEENIEFVYKSDIVYY